jgi:undecaprenyl diphosphate synthase
MDGNGRWASARGLPRLAGHRAGAETVNRIVEAAPALGVGVLTLYAFSSDNWKRPEEEVEGLFRLFRQYLAGESARLAANGIRFQMIGRRDRLPQGVIEAVEDCERLTTGGNTMRLRVAVDYSSRDSILAAIQRLPRAVALDRAGFSTLLDPPESPDVDLLIRTGGEQRLSDFLLWESAYAELCFLAVPWPDFSVVDMEAAVLDFRRRQRRFGGLPPVQLPAAEAGRPFL